MSTTVGGIVDRILRDYIENPADLGVQSVVVNVVTDSQTSIVYSTGLTAEEVARLSVNTIVEMGLERMRVTAHDEDTRTLTVLRGVQGTTAAEHAANTVMRVAPALGRMTIFEIVCDEIVELSPELYTVATDYGDPGDTALDVSGTPLAVLSATQRVGSEPVDVEARVVYSEEFFPDSGSGIYYEPLAVSEEVFIRYSKALTRPTAESDTLASLGIEASWERIIIYGVLANLMVGFDIDAATQEFITEALQAEAFPPTTGTNLTVALSRLREAMLMRAADRLIARDGVRQSFTSVL